MFPTVHIFQKSVTSPRQTEHPVSALDLGLNVATAFLGVLVFVYGLQGSLETLWKEMGCPWPDFGDFWDFWEDFWER